MMSDGETKAVRVLISGRVQGVGFRYWTLRAAEDRGLSGWVRNLPDGRVEALFSGPPARVDEMLAACHKGPRFSAVRSVEIEEAESPEAAGFRTIG